MKVSELVDRLINTGEWLEIIFDKKLSCVSYDGEYSPAIVQIEYNLELGGNIHFVYTIEQFKRAFNGDITVLEK